jgi:hypothetical protein
MSLSIGFFMHAFLADLSVPSKKAFLNKGGKILNFAAMVDNTAFGVQTQFAIGWYFPAGGFLEHEKNGTGRHFAGFAKKRWTTQITNPAQEFLRLPPGKMIQCRLQAGQSRPQLFGYCKTGSCKSKPDVRFSQEAVGRGV